jgi:hypothetical protein
VVTIAGVELTLAGNKTENDGEGAGTDARLWSNLGKEKGVFITKFDKAVFGGCCFEFEQ